MTGCYFVGGDKIKVVMCMYEREEKKALVLCVCERKYECVCVKAWGNG